ncbi:MAG: hypothetical protein HQK53_15830 [Oligoflexia bacterium]|nr:hypothetical protein [Oligoflexia bacterium]
MFNGLHRHNQSRCRSSLLCLSIICFVSLLSTTAAANTPEEKEYQEYLQKYGGDPLVKKHSEQTNATPPPPSPSESPTTPSSTPLPPQPSDQQNANNAQKQFTWPAENPLSKFSDEEIHSKLKETLQKIPFASGIFTYPKVVTTYIKIIKNDLIYKDVLKTYKNTDRFNLYRLIALGGSILILLIGFFFSHGGGFISSILKKIFFACVLTIFHLGLFSFYFPQATGTIAKIIKTTF